MPSPEEIAIAKAFLAQQPLPPMSFAPEPAPNMSPAPDPAQAGPVDWAQDVPVVQPPPDLVPAPLPPGVQLAGPAGPPAPPVGAGQYSAPPVPGSPTPPMGGGRHQAPGAAPWLRQAMAAEVGAPEGTVRHRVGDVVEPYTPEDRSALAEHGQESLQHIQDLGDAQEYARQATARAAAAADEKQQAVEAQMQRRHDERIHELQRMEQHYRDMSDQAAATPIDSNRLWDSQSTGEEIVSKIALALATVGFGVAGTPNLVWEGIQRNIDRDIDAQKANKAMLQSRLAAEGTLIGMARDRFADEATQDAAMRAAAYQRASNEIARFADFAKTPERAAQLSALKAEADRAFTAQEIQMRREMDTSLLQQRQIDARRAAASAPLSPLQRAKQLAQLRGYQAATAKSEREIAGVPEPGDTGPVPLWGANVPKESAKQAREFSAVTEELKGSIAEYRNMGVGEAGVGAAQANIAVGLKKLATAAGATGLSSNEDMALLTAGIPDPSNPNFSKRMDQLAGSIKRAEDAVKRSYGVPVVTPKKK